MPNGKELVQDFESFEEFVKTALLTIWLWHYVSPRHIAALKERAAAIKEAQKKHKMGSVEVPRLSVSLRMMIRRLLARELSFKELYDLVAVGCVAWDEERDQLPLVDRHVDAVVLENDQGVPAEEDLVDEAPEAEFDAGKLTVTTEKRAQRKPRSFRSFTSSSYSKSLSSA